MTENQINLKSGLGTAEAEHAQNCSPAPKWAALIGDRLFPMPRRKLAARDILDQAGVGMDFVLVRDHGSANDVVLKDDALVDLAEGNVFRVIPRCEAAPQPPCTGPAKLAFVCDDEWEVTLIGRQTGHSLKRLLGLPDDAVLFRDYESPDDQPIADDQAVDFRDGAVFTCRNQHSARETKIFVNGREKVVAGKTISYADLVVLAFGAIDPNTIYTITFKHGPPSKPEGKMVEGDVVKLQCGMHFNVTPTGKS
jgi:Multiubiquitin